MIINKFWNMRVNQSYRYHSHSDKANLRDLLAATSLVVLLKLDSNRRFFCPCDLETIVHLLVVVVTLFPTEKQSTAYMSKDTYVNQYTLMFCWWSPEKPKAYLAGNLFYTMSSIVHHFKAMGEFNWSYSPETPTSGQNWRFYPVWPSNLTDELGIPWI